MAPEAKNGDHFAVIPVANVEKVSMNAIRYSKLLGSAIVAVHILLHPSCRQEMESRYSIFP